MTDASVLLWQERLRPILDALCEHVTVDEMVTLRNETITNEETPAVVASIIDDLFRLRVSVELMHREL